MQVKKYQDDNEVIWDNFVHSHPQGRFVHTTGFKHLIEKIFHYRSSYWFIEEGSEILALIPSFVYQGIIGGKRLISQPFSEYGGLLVKPGTSWEEIKNILEFFSKEVKRFLDDSKLDFLEIHQGLDIPSDLENKYFKKLFLYQYAVLKLDDPVKLWEERLNYEVKKALNKAESSNIKVLHQANPEILKKRFYPLYLSSMKRLGSPPHSLDYFLKGYEYLKENIELFLAEKEGKTLACLLGWKEGKRVQITDTASDEKSWQLRANDLLHWEFVKWAAKEGFEYFDMGPARYEGQIRYKKKWGCDFYDYNYYYLPADDGFKVKKPLDENNYFIRIISYFWKFIPTTLTSHVGEFFRKNLGK